MFPTNDDCDECTPSYLDETATFGSKAAYSTLPFCATFILITIIAYRKIFPLLSNPTSKQNASKLPAPVTSVQEPPTQAVVRQIAALTFSSTIALSVVLTELLLCEISNSFNPTARSVALQITVASLLGLLVIAIPLLGISSVVSRSGYRFSAEQRGRRRLAWLLEFAGYVVFLFGFWCIGVLLPNNRTFKDTLREHTSLFQACLDRLGITGVSLMALLSGFASVSAIWQNFGPKPRLVDESMITKKRSSLEAIQSTIAAKRNELQQLENRMTESPSNKKGSSFWGRTIGSFRGNADAKEKQMLEMEIAGLETLTSSLETSLSVSRQRRNDQLRASTRFGRLLVVFSYIFSCYCVYRIVMTTVNITRRTFSTGSQPNNNTSTSTSSSSDTDPITQGIALVARYIYPSLNQASWAQQISFLLSGVMLLASFSAVTQTFHLFSRFMPSLLHATKTNFALLISQISGMYVISSALMLRGMMPREVGSVINGALGDGLLDPVWVQKWFDGFFMSAVVLTALGIWVGRRVGGAGGGGSFMDDDDDLGWSDGVEFNEKRL